MAEAKTDQEPSIEEILESIRQIISDDPEQAQAAAPVAPKPVAEEKPMPAAAPYRAPEPEPELNPEEFVIDLTDIVEEPPAPPEPEPEIEEAVPAPPQTEELISMTDQHIEEPQAHHAAPEDTASLLSDTTADAATSAMAKLLSGNVAIERDDHERLGNVTLEDLARDLMRPLIKTWLDQNLPRVIEKIVAREIEKLSRRALDQ